MKTKFILTAFISVFALMNLKAQSIKLSDGKILSDGKEMLSFKKGNSSTEFTIYKLNTTEELVFIMWDDNQTRTTSTDDYYRINFLPLKLKMESSNVKFNWKKCVEWLFQNGIFSESGELNQEKINNFVS